jgi:hypothetical protein
MKLVTLLESNKLRAEALKLQQAFIDASDGLLDIKLAPYDGGILIIARNPKNRTAHVEAWVHSYDSDPDTVLINSRGNSWRTTDERYVLRLTRQILRYTLGWRLEECKSFGSSMLKLLKTGDWALGFNDRWYSFGARVKHGDLKVGSEYFVGIQNQIQIHISYTFTPVRYEAAAVKEGARWKTPAKWIRLYEGGPWKWPESATPIFFEMVKYG